MMSFRSLFSMFSALVISAALVLGLSVTPSLAVASNPTKGTDQLLRTDAAAERVAEKTAPMGLSEVESRSQGGLNEIQGAADADKMYKSDSSQPGPALAKKLETVLDKVTK